MIGKKFIEVHLTASKVIVITATVFFCIMVAFAIDYTYGMDSVYTHLYYLPIVLTGVWFNRKVYLVAGISAVSHIVTNYYLLGSFDYSTLLRALVFFIVAAVVKALMQRSEMYQEQLFAQNERFRLMNESMLDIVGRIDLDGNFDYVSQSVKMILGYSPDEMQSMNLFSIIYPDDKALVMGKFKNSIEAGASIFLEARCIRKDGTVIWIESSANLVRLESSETKGDFFVFGAREITKRKAAEKKFEYLLQHDHLTGLTNRAHLENVFHNLDQMNQIAVFSVDIDGLKCVNDTYGHIEGDKLILEATNILTKCFRTKDTVTRTGGDEFIAIVSPCTAKSAETLKKRIQAAIGNQNETISPQYLKISLSVGYAIGKSDAQGIDELIKQADMEMYAEKNEKKKKNGTVNCRD